MNNQLRKKVMERRDGSAEVVSSRSGLRRIIGRLGLVKSAELSPEAQEWADRMTAAGFRVHMDDNLGHRYEGPSGDIPLRGEGTNDVRAAKIIGAALRGQPYEGL